MSREFKIGLLTFLVLISLIWGYTFLKGRNLLTKSVELYSTYSDVTDLNVSSPVLVNGYKVGTVTRIELNSQDVKKMNVYYLIDGDYKIPKNAIAVLKSLGFVSGKGIFLQFDKECQGADCVAKGDKLEGSTLGLLGAMLGDVDVSDYSTEFTESLRTIISNIGAPNEPGSFNETVRQLEIITKNVARLTQHTDEVVLSSAQDLKNTLSHLNTLSRTLAQSSQNIESIVKQMDQFTADLAQSEVSSTVANLNETLTDTRSTFQTLKTTMVSAQSTLDGLSLTLNNINSGQGSLAKLMNDKNLYQNLDMTTKNLNLLLQDVRLNPKRYAHFSVFGKRGKEYILPENDPAYQDQ